jgi:hypothetical protein
VALGGVIGPLLVVVFSVFSSPQGVFLTAGALIAVTVLLAIVVLKEPKHTPKEAGDVALAVDRQRALSAQASLRGVVLRAQAARQARASL